jgi:hypothetical protein
VQDGLFLFTDKDVDDLLAGLTHEDETNLGWVPRLCVLSDEAGAMRSTRPTTSITAVRACCALWDRFLDKLVASNARLRPAGSQWPQHGRQ